MSIEPTIKQRLFVKYLLDDPKRDRVAAARKAGYSDPESNGSKIVDRLLDRAVRSAAMSVDEVLARLSDIACVSLDQFIHVDAKGEWKPDLQKARKAKAMGRLKKLKHTAFGYEIELHDPMAALEKLGRHWGAFKDGPNQGNDGPLETIDSEEAIYLARAIAKAKAEFDERKRGDQPIGQNQEGDSCITPDGRDDGT